MFSGSSIQPVPLADPWNISNDGDVDSKSSPANRSQALRWYFMWTEEGSIASLSAVDSSKGPPITIPLNQGLKNIIIQEDELQAIPKQEAVRLRLHDQAPFKMNSDAEISINLKSTASAGTYQLHYIEMDFFSKETNDYLLYGKSRPDLSVKVGCSIAAPLEGPITVHSHCVSRSSSYAATLCFHAGQAVVEVWDIAISGDVASPVTPQHRSVPSAWGSIPAETVPKPDSTTLCLSCSGSSVTLLTDGSADPHIPFQLMSWTLPGTCHDGDANPKALSFRRPCSGLEGYHGFGAFAAVGEGLPENRCERYLTCDGITVSVYTTTGDWSLLRTITLGLGRNLVAARNVGSTVDFINLSPEDTEPTHKTRFESPESKEIEVLKLNPLETRSASATDILYTLSLKGNTIEVNIDYMGVYDDTELISIPLDVEEPSLVPVVFIPQQCRLLIITDYLYIWDLPKSPSTGIALIQVGALLTPQITHYGAVTRAWTHDNGRQFSLTLTPYSLDLCGDSQETQHTLTYPASERENFPIPEMDRTRQGIKGAVKIYRNMEFSPRKEQQNRAIIAYLNTLVRPSSTNPISCIDTLCRLWNSDESSQFKTIIAKLLSTTNGSFDNPIVPRTYFSYWIPQSTLKKSSDPLAMLLQKAETEPGALEAANKVIGYCGYAARSTCNLTFLAPVYGSLRELMDISPELVHENLKTGIIHIQNKQHRSFIVNNHIIAHPPKFRLRFWKPVSRPLHECGNPIMQLHVSSANSPVASKFNREVFVASFDALWFRIDSTTGYNNTKQDAPAKINPAFNKATTTTVISWWKVLFCMIRVKLRSKNYVHVACYVYDLKCLENPAIASLVAYKWNTIGFSYWLLRFVYQCCYYILIIIAAVLQIYPSEKTILVGIFIAIITLATVFIWLEVVQACHDWRKYHRSKYNALDVLAFTLPLGASIDQLLDLTRTEPTENVRPLSFSVLIVFLHMLFELRINKSVCKHVTIIEHILSEIRIFFFFIFAGGIVAFSLGLMHLLHGCPLQGCKDERASESFPRNFFGVLSSTYFFMGGRYDSVSDKLSSEDWAFHLMMAFFFFFTVIVMLNVLIALINVAFTKGDDVWRLTWVESRLRYIEAAENMSYHIPGFREAYNWFPNEIYYTMTRDQWEEYERMKGQAEEYDS
ncbi:unnamed protein product [Mortierella alpina]